MARSTPSRFTAPSTQLATSATTITAVSTAGTSNIIYSLKFTNTSTTLQETVKVYRYLTGNTPGDSELIAEKVVLPRQTWNCIEAVNFVVENGETLGATTTTATTVNVDANGVISVS